MNFAVLLLYVKVFSTKFGVWHPLIGAAKASSSQKFSLQSYFHQLCESFLSQKFPAIQYVLKFIGRACR